MKDKLITNQKIEQKISFTGFEDLKVNKSKTVKQFFPKVKYIIHTRKKGMWKILDNF